MADKITVTLVRSSIGTTEKQKANLRGLGLKKIGVARVLENTPAVRGMVKKVLHLVEVSEGEVAHGE